MSYHVVPLLFLACITTTAAIAVDRAALKKEPAVFQEATVREESSDFIISLSGLERAIRKKLDLNARDSGGLTVLAYSVSDGNPKAIRILVRAGASPALRFTDQGVKEVTVAHMAADSGCQRCLGILIATDSSLLQAKDSNGETPIFRAVRGAQLQQVKLLWTMGTDVKLKNRKGLTIVDLPEAKGKKNERMAEVLEQIQAEER